MLNFPFLIFFKRTLTTPIQQHPNYDRRRIPSRRRPWHGKAAPKKCLNEYIFRVAGAAYEGHNESILTLVTARTLHADEGEAETVLMR